MIRVWAVEGMAESASPGGKEMRPSCTKKRSPEWSVAVVSVVELCLGWRDIQETKCEAVISLQIPMQGIGS